MQSVSVNSAKIGAILIDKMMNLNEIVLSKCGISDIKVLADAMNNQIRSIDLSFNNLECEQMHQINRILGKNCIKQLSLNHNPIGPLGARVLARGLEGNRSLLILNLSYCYLQGESSSIFKSLSKHLLIDYLDMSNNYCTDTVIDTVCDMLRTTNSLR